MDDTLKNLTLGFLALLAVHGSLEKRAKRDATRTVREAFHSTGVVRSEVEPRGMFGLAVNDAWAVDIYGDNLRAERLPFLLAPRAGWKGSIRHLRLHLTNLYLAGLPIERLEADIPFVTYDIGQALYKDRLVLRGAGWGPATVYVNRAGLQSYLSIKYQKTLSDVIVWIQNKKIYVSAQAILPLFGASTVVASGTVLPREGRFLDLADPVLQVNGQAMPTRTIQTLLQQMQINPIVDLEADLHLRGAFYVSQVEIGDRLLILHGRVTIPRANISSRATYEEKLWRLRQSADEYESDKEMLWKLP